LTFGARQQEELLPVAKISVIDSHLDIQEILQFVKENTLERFGPVRTVKPELVYEILFDGITRSSRRKSGFILNNPKIRKKIEPDTMVVHDINYLKGLLSTGKD
jgi:DNA ligase-1